MATPELAPAQPVRIDSIVPDPNQPRRSTTPEDLAELVLSIRAHGVISPVLLSPHPNPAVRDKTPFMLVAGERRWAAARNAGLLHVPAILSGEFLAPADRLMVQLDENDGELRRELSLAERVDAVVRAFKLSGLRKDEFAAAHGKSPSWLSRYCALGSADGTTRAALEEGHLTGMTAARLFVRLGFADRLDLLERARRNRLPITDRVIEAAAQRHEREAAGGAVSGPAADSRPERGSRSSPDPSPASAAPAPAGSRSAIPRADRPNRFDRFDRAERSARAAGSAGLTPGSAGGLGAAPMLIYFEQMGRLLVCLGQEPHPDPDERRRQLEAFIN